nr:hypothetical protein [Tanacetum cinerariifolium]
EVVLVLSDQTLVLSQLDAGAFHRGARLRQIQGRRHTDFVAARGQAQAFFKGTQGVLSQLEQFLVRLPGQISIGDVGHQADLRAATGFFAGEVGLEGLLAQA